MKIVEFSNSDPFNWKFWKENHIAQKLKFPKIWVYRASMSHFPEIDLYRGTPRKAANSAVDFISKRKITPSQSPSQAFLGCHSMSRSPLGGVSWHAKERLRRRLPLAWPGEIINTFICRTYVRLHKRLNKIMQNNTPVGSKGSLKRFLENILNYR